MKSHVTRVRVVFVIILLTVLHRKQISRCKHTCTPVANDEKSIHWTKIKTLHFLTSDCVALVTYASISFMPLNWTDVLDLIHKVAASNFASVRSYSSLYEICIFWSRAHEKHHIWLTLRQGSCGKSQNSKTDKTVTILHSAVVNTIKLTVFSNYLPCN